MKIHAYAAFILSAIFSLASLPAYSESSQVFGGYTTWNNYGYGYVGGVTALNKDLKSDGFLARGSAGYGQYNYSSLAAGGKVDGERTTGDLMLGYQHFFSALNGGRFAFYLGGGYENDSLNRSDRTNPVRSDQWGIDAMAQLRVNIDDKTYINGEATYSTAFNTYWTNGRFGYNFGRFAIGPEIGFIGNDAFDAQRIGAFIGDIMITDDLTASFSGGYSHAQRQFDSGGYVDASLGYAF